MGYFPSIVEKDPPYLIPHKDEFSKGENNISLSTNEWCLLFEQEGSYFYKTNDVSAPEEEISLEGLTFSTEGEDDCTNIILFNPKTKGTLFYHMPVMSLQSSDIDSVLDEAFNKINVPGCMEYAVMCIVMVPTIDRLSFLLDKLRPKDITSLFLEYGKVFSYCSNENNPKYRGVSSYFVYEKDPALRIYGLGRRQEGLQLIEESTVFELFGSAKNILFNPSTGKFWSS